MAKASKVRRTLTSRARSIKVPSIREARRLVRERERQYLVAQMNLHIDRLMKTLVELWAYSLEERGKSLRDELSGKRTKGGKHGKVS